MGLMRQGMVLDKVVLLGRTLEEYQRFFALDLEALRGKEVLDVASGVSSFTAEANRAGLKATASDPIYTLPADTIRQRCEPDLDRVIDAVRGLKTYQWEFYRSPEILRTFRERAYRAFLADFVEHGARRYIPASLPVLPFADEQFDLTLVSYLLLVYEDHLDYEFHKRSLLEIMRVTRGEARIYPTVTFETVPCTYLDRMTHDPDLVNIGFEMVETDFEFLVGSDRYLRIFRR